MNAVFKTTTVEKAFGIPFSSSGLTSLCQSDLSCWLNKEAITVLQLSAKKKGIFKKFSPFEKQLKKIVFRFSALKASSECDISNTTRRTEEKSEAAPSLSSQPAADSRAHKISS